MAITREAGAQDVSLEVPAEESSLLVVRLATSGAAAHGSFDMDTLEDVKTAVNEACYLMIHQQKAFERLRIIFSRESSLSIRVLGEGCCREKLSEADPDLDVCEMVLGSLVDSIHIQTEDGRILAIEIKKAYA